MIPVSIWLTSIWYVLSLEISVFLFFLYCLLSPLSLALSLVSARCRSLKPLAPLLVRHPSRSNIRSCSPLLVSCVIRLFVPAADMVLRASPTLILGTALQFVAYVDHPPNKTTLSIFQRLHDCATQCDLRLSKLVHEHQASMERGLNKTNGFMNTLTCILHGVS